VVDHSENLIDAVLSSAVKDTLSFGKFGIEKESLRIIQSQITQSTHPKKIGSALCNRYITTDFSESQLELITPPLSDKTAGLEFLDHIHHFVSHNINKEILWPFSMPPTIKSEQDLPIADYGISNLGLFKQLYRKGLSHRYGRSMQAISGVHYNYSLPDSIFHSSFFEDHQLDFRAIRSDSYFRMLRNIYRMNWLVIYLFGASPVLTKDLLAKNTEPIQKLDNQTYYLPYATSLRMSDFGYQNLLRAALNISSDSLNDYISDLNMATSTISEDFQNIDTQNNTNQLQINANLLQTEDEYYAVARSKSNIISNQRLTSKLKKGGVDFIELRSLDLNPFSRIGIDEETVYFLEVFLIYCFLTTSHLINKDELKTTKDNDSLVAKRGRDPSLLLQKDQASISLQEWGKQIVDEMTPIAELLDGEETVYRNMMCKIASKIKDPDQTLSGLLLDKIITEKVDFIDLGNSIGETNKQHYLDLEKSANPNWDRLEKEAIDSMSQQSTLEEEQNESFESFVADYFDT
jgi:glutamate--cysteine ligase